MTLCFPYRNKLNLWISEIIFFQNHNLNHSCGFFKKYLSIYGRVTKPVRKIFHIRPFEHKHGLFCIFFKGPFKSKRDLFFSPLYKPFFWFFKVIFSNQHLSYSFVLSILFYLYFCLTHNKFKKNIFFSEKSSIFYKYCQTTIRDF